MKYKLSLKDYKKLWLLMTPEEIVQEFGIYSQTPRQIRNYYSDYGVSKVKQARKELTEKIEGKFPWEPSTMELLEQTLQELKAQAIDGVWKDIKEFV